MIPPLVALAKQSADLVEMLGDDPFRFYAFGDAGDERIYPYVTYQTVGGNPENYLAGRPDADAWSLQVDCWAHSEAESESIARHIRDAVELNAYITSWNGSGRDAVTRNYRFSFTVDFSLDR